MNHLILVRPSLSLLRRKGGEELERATRFELATPSLGSLYSTN